MKDDLFFQCCMKVEVAFGNMLVLCGLRSGSVTDEVTVFPSVVCDCADGGGLLAC